MCVYVRKERDTCAGLFLLPPRCGSLPPRPACPAPWPPGLLRNQTVAPAQYTAFCEHTRQHNFKSLHYFTPQTYIPYELCKKVCLMSNRQEINDIYSFQLHAESESHSKISLPASYYSCQKCFQIQGMWQCVANLLCITSITGTPTIYHAV